GRCVAATRQQWHSRHRGQGTDQQKQSPAHGGTGLMSGETVCSPVQVSVKPGRLRGAEWLARSTRTPCSGAPLSLLQTFAQARDSSIHFLLGIEMVEHFIRLNTGAMNSGARWRLPVRARVLDGPGADA